MLFRLLNGDLFEVEDAKTYCQVYDVYQSLYPEPKIEPEQLSFFTEDTKIPRGAIHNYQELCIVVQPIESVDELGFDAILRVNNIDLSEYSKRHNRRYKEVVWVNKHTTVGGREYKIYMVEANHRGHFYLDVYPYMSYQRLKDIRDSISELGRKRIDWLLTNT